MCVDFQKINKACPKNAYPVNRIDQLVDVTSVHEILSFTYTYLGYNLIRSIPNDEVDSSFYADNNILCLKVIFFRLVIIEATYQRMINKLLENMLV